MWSQPLKALVLRITTKAMKTYNTGQMAKVPMPGRLQAAALFPELPTLHWWPRAMLGKGQGHIWPLGKINSFQNIFPG